MVEENVSKGDIFNGPTNIDLCLNGQLLGRSLLFFINLPEQGREKVRLEFLMDSVFNVPSDNDTEDDSGPGMTQWILIGRVSDGEQYEEIFGKFSLSGPEWLFIAEYSSYTRKGKIKFILSSDFLKNEAERQRALLAS